jgi:anti-anti-sigma factor
VRCHGPIDRAAGLGADVHACWAYKDEQSLRAAATEFLEEGLEHGQRLVYVAAGGRDLGADLAGLARIDDLIERGVLELVPHGALYEVARPFADPDAQLERFAAATSRAQADGFSGLRVVSELTGLVRDPEVWDAFARFDACADRFMAGEPLSFLCCFDRRELPEDLVGDIARVHPCANVTGELAGFRMFAVDGTMILDGEVDAFSRDAFNRLLEHAIPDDDRSVLDLSALGFIDHSGVLALANRVDAVADGGGRLELTGTPSQVMRMCDLLGVKLPVA